MLLEFRNVFGRVPPFSNPGNGPAGDNPLDPDPLLRTFYLNTNYRL